MSAPHVFLIAAITIDGFLTRTPDQPATWSSSEDKRFFRERTMQSGVMVIGSGTYKTFSKPLPDREHIILSHNPEQFESQQNVRFMSGEPADIINQLQIDGYEDIAICGGSHVYSQFIAANAIDTLYLTIEPRLFGEGVPLLSDSVDVRFSLDSTDHLNSDSLLLTYVRAED